MIFGDGTFPYCLAERDVHRSAGLCQLVRTGAGTAAAETSPHPSLDDLASFARTHLPLPVCLEDLKTIQLREEQASCLTSYQT